MDKFKEPQSNKKEKDISAELLPQQPEVRGEAESPEKQYEYLQKELTEKYRALEIQFKFDIEDINKKTVALREKQIQLRQLSSLLDDLTESWTHKKSKEQIAKNIADLETTLAKIPPKKVGFVGFRKKFEDTKKTAPVKRQLQQERERLLELDRKIKEEAGSNKKRFPVLAIELNIEEPVTKEKINMAIPALEIELGDLIKQQERVKQKFISQRDSWPIVGFAPDDHTPQVTQVEIKDKEPGTAFGVIAYGGNSYSERTRRGNWPNIPQGTLGDDYGLYGKGIAFGSGEKDGKRYIILRQLQKAGNRNYAYTVLLDPGEEVRQKSDFNDATIIRNILADPVLKHYLLNEPEKISEMRKILLSRLEQSYLKTEPHGNTALDPFIQDIGTEQSPIIFDQSLIAEPIPEKLAQAIATLSEEQRRKLTFLIRGDKNHGQSLGTWNIWDPKR